MTAKYYIYKLKLFPHYRNESNHDEDFSRILGEHFSYLKDLLDRNVLILAGRSITEITDERIADKNTDWSRVFGIAIFKVESDEDALEIMKNDPAVKNKIMEADLHEFSLALVKK